MSSLKRITEAIAGDVPIIITVRHDGQATVFGDEILPELGKGSNDRGTMILGLKTHGRYMRVYGKKPFLILNKIRRNRCSPEMWGEYYEEVLHAVRFCLHKYGKCFVFDLHRFYKYPAVGEYNVFLGTNHKQTMRDGTDKRFADILVDCMWHEERAMIRVYVPGKEGKAGERFMADRPKTLVNWLKREESRVEALQIEFYKDFFDNVFFVDSLPRALARAIHDTAL